MQEQNTNFRLSKACKFKTKSVKYIVSILRQSSWNKPIVLVLAKVALMKHFQNLLPFINFNRVEVLSKPRNARIRVTQENLDEMFCFDLGLLQIPHNLRDLLQSNMGTVDPRVEQSQYLRFPHSIYSNSRGAKFFVQRLFCKQITVQIKVLRQILLSRPMNNAALLRQTQKRSVFSSHQSSPQSLIYNSNFSY